MSTTDHCNRAFSAAGFALPSTEVRIEVEDNCRYINPAFENLATIDPQDKHQYEDPACVRNQILMGNNGTGPRAKRNEVYESTSDLSPLKRSPFPRSRHTDTECSEDSTTSMDVNFSRDSRISRIVLFLVLAVSVISLLLVILMMRGVVGPNCGCSQKSNGVGKTAKIIGDEPLPNTESKFEAIISELMKNVSNLETSLIANFNVTTKLAELGSSVVELKAKIKRLQDEKRQVVEALKSTDSYLNKTVKQLREEVSKIDPSLKSKFNNVSKIRGPMGPRGFNGTQGVIGPQGPTGPQGPIGPQGLSGSGNLSQCVHKESSSSLGSLMMDHILKPDQNEVIMGVTCASSNTLLKVFHHIRFDTSTNRYVCRCTTDQPDNYKCVIHYWSCPKIS